MAKKLFAGDQPLDPDLLTPEEIDELRAEAEAEAAAERKTAAKEAMRKKLVREARQKKGLEEEQVQVTVDLAPYADRILLDNKAFLQGRTYTVPAGQAAVIREIAQRTWGHQSEIDGKSENFYRKTRGARVIPAGDGAAVINTSQILRA